MSIEHPFRSSSRREFLERAGLGFGSVAAAYLLNRDPLMAAPSPLAPKAPPLPATAKRVISLFMHGGPSHLETFDPKPLLNKLHGQPVPESFGNVQLQVSEFRKQPILGSSRNFAQHGQSGIVISDLFPNVAQHADDLAVIRSCYHDGFTHTAALNLLNNGWSRLGRPSMGSWIVYGLGSETEDLPAFVVMLEGGIKSGSAVYQSGFLPALYQATTLRPGATPILNAKPPEGLTEQDQRRMFDLLRRYNEQHAADRSDESALQARINSYELAFKLQTSAPSQPNQDLQQRHRIRESRRRGPTARWAPWASRGAAGPASRRCRETASDVPRQPARTHPMWEQGRRRGRFPHHEALDHGPEPEPDR
jgi:hypothetical protein